MGWYYWRRDWDSFSPLVLGAHHLAPVATHALFIHRAATVLPSRPVSLTFATLAFHPPDALDSASNPTFFSLCFFSRDIRHTKYDIRVFGGEGGIPSPPSLSLLRRSRPPSLSFALLTFPPTEAFGSASNPTFFSLCFFSRDIRHTIYDSWRRGRDSNPRSTFMSA